MFYIALSDFLKTQSFTLFPIKSLHCIPIGKSPNPLAWHRRLKPYFFFPIEQTVLFPMSISNAVSTWIVTTLHSQTLTPLKPCWYNLFYLQSISCVPTGLFLLSKSDQHALLEVFHHTEYILLCALHWTDLFHNFSPRNDTLRPEIWITQHSTLSIQ